MRILFYDNSTVYVTDAQGERIKQAVTAGSEWIEIDNTMYAVKSIKQVQADKQLKINQPQLPVGAIELSEERRRKNIKRIQEMKKKFFSRRKIIES